MYGGADTESSATVFCLASTSVCGGSATVAILGQAQQTGNGSGVKGIGPVDGVIGISNGTTVGIGVDAESSASRGTGLLATADTAVDAEGVTEGVIAKGHIAVFAQGEIAGVTANASDPDGDAVTANNTAGGVALQVIGKATFDHSVVAIVPAGKQAVTVSLAGVTTSSFVLATAQQNASVYVKSATAKAGSFTIRITGAAPQGGLKVAYFVLN